jgi:hypothetical protein
MANLTEKNAKPLLLCFLFGRILPYAKARVTFEESIGKAHGSV